MGSLSIRNLEDGVIARLKQRAALHGRSTEAEIRDILTQASTRGSEPNFEQLAAEIRKLTAGRIQEPSEVLIREDRD